jgi:glycosyltransferase involved in cell wall biosynthesis
MHCSVIICTHNPRPDYLRRVLDALKAQTLPKEQWELLLIDNASKEPLGKNWDLSWHPHARHIREDELGLTPARLRGIKESTGELLIFVDDDNLLAAGYLEQAIRIAGEFPQIGAFGGSIKGEFEIAPPDWIEPYLEGLAVCELDRDYWSNSGGWSKSSPYGAGLCVRHNIAEDYAQKVSSSGLRRLLDRSGTGMGAGGDGDLAWCAIDLGMGIGRFAALKVLHLIPERRLTKDYIIRLNAGFASAGVILSILRNSGQISKVSPWKQRCRFLYELLTVRGVQRQILLASRKARKETKRLIETRGSTL